MAPRACTSERAECVYTSMAATRTGCTLIDVCIVERQYESLAVTAIRNSYSIIAQCLSLI